MKVFNLRTQEFYGTIRKNPSGKVVVDIKMDSLHQLFSKIGAGEKAYTPADGDSYLAALITEFTFSSMIELVKEPEDETWLEKVQQK